MYCIGLGNRTIRDIMLINVQFACFGVGILCLCDIYCFTFPFEMCDTERTLYDIVKYLN